MEISRYLKDSQISEFLLTINIERRVICQDEANARPIVTIHIRKHKCTVSGLKNRRGSRNQWMCPSSNLDEGFGLSFSGVFESKYSEGSWLGKGGHLSSGGNEKDMNTVWQVE